MLKSPKSPDNSVPRWYLDIETGSEGELLDICLELDDSGAQYYFQDWPSMVNFVFKQLAHEPGAKRQIWAHNGNGFDWVCLVQAWLNNREQFVAFEMTKFIVSGSRLIGIVCKFGNSEITLCDTFSYLKGSLEKVCQAFGIEFRKSDLSTEYKERMQDFKKLFPVEYYSYLADDVRNLKSAFELFAGMVSEQFAVNKMPLSASSLSMKVFRACYMGDLIIYTPARGMKKTEREAYTGGLTGWYGLADNPETMCEGMKKHGVSNAVFEKAKSHVYCDLYHYDVNSMYPSIMAQMKFPKTTGCRTASFIWEIGNDISERKTKKAKLGYGVYNIEYEQTGGTVPVLKPVIDGKRSEYGEWKGRGTFTHLEIEYLLELGGNVSITEEGGIYYSIEDRAPYLREYALDLYNRRLDAKASGNAVLTELYKLLMNSLYGKFGEREEDREIKIVKESEMPDEATIIHTFDDAERYLLIETVNEDTAEMRRHVFPAVAAMITAAARVKLLRVLNSGAPVVYVDTDSAFIAGEKLPAEIVNRDALGMWKLEAQYPWAAFFGKKQYVIPILKTGDLKAKNKGAPKVNASVYLIDMMRDGRTTVDYRSPTSFKAAIRALDRPSARFEKRSRTVAVQRSARARIAKRLK